MSNKTILRRVLFVITIIITIIKIYRWFIGENYGFDHIYSFYGGHSLFLLTFVSWGVIFLILLGLIYRDLKISIISVVMNIILCGYTFCSSIIHVLSRNDFYVGNDFLLNFVLLIISIITLNLTKKNDSKINELSRNEKMALCLVSTLFFIVIILFTINFTRMEKNKDNREQEIRERVKEIGLIAEEVYEKEGKDGYVCYPFKYLEENDYLEKDYFETGSVEIDNRWSEKNIRVWYEYSNYYVAGVDIRDNNYEIGSYGPTNFESLNCGEDPDETYNEEY